MQVKLCVTRGFQRLRGDMSLALSGAIGNFIMALIIGSVFYNLPHNTGSFYSRGALLFFAILLNAFSSSLEVRDLFYPRRHTDIAASRFSLYTHNDRSSRSKQSMHSTILSQKQWRP